MARKRKHFSAPTPLFGTRRQFRPAAQSLSPKAAAVQTQSVQHGEIAPVGTYTLRGCCSKPKKGQGLEDRGQKTCNMPPKPGQAELVFPSRKDVEKYKTKAGPALWLCTGTHKGTLLPVPDPRTAKKIAERYRACADGKRAKVKACIAEVVAQPVAALGGVRPKGGVQFVAGDEPSSLGAAKGEFVTGRKLPTFLRRRAS